MGLADLSKLFYRFPASASANFVSYYTIFGFICIVHRDTFCLFPVAGLRLETYLDTRFHYFSPSNIYICIEEGTRGNGACIGSN